MKNLSFKTVEKATCDFALWVNHNHTKLQKSYTNKGIDPNFLNFVEFCVMVYLEEQKELVGS
jgi:hypothetical protein